jgi:hypothetical protein
MWSSNTGPSPALMSANAQEGDSDRPYVMLHLRSQQIFAALQHENADGAEGAGRSGPRVLKLVNTGGRQAKVVETLRRTET